MQEAGNGAKCAVYWRSTEGAFNIQPTLRTNTDLKMGRIQMFKKSNHRLLLSQTLADS